MQHRWWICILVLYCRGGSAFVCRPLQAAMRNTALSRVCTRGGLQMVAVGKKGVLSKAFMKPTGALTVSLEYEREAKSEYTENDLFVLSMQLRKIKCAALWTYRLEDLSIISKEQKAAKGNFPGPCPVIYYPPLSTPDKEQIEAAGKAGAHAVVLTCDLLHLAETAGEQNMEVVWDVKSVEDITRVVDAGHGVNFLMSAADAGGLLAALPADAVGIAYVDSQNDEISIGRALAKGKDGVKSLLVRQACLGDAAWDLRYARFAIDSLTSKANPEFQITGIGSSKGSAGDGRRSYGSDASGRAMQDGMSTQKDINLFHDKPGGTDFKKIADRGTTW